ncbi:MAG: aspartate-semialdehyde dehydrogenase [Flavobacteriales bacterium]|nr:aspartate-semialdehyde dehydrogenase [Flavobacteriales bacterium]
MSPSTHGRTVAVIGATGLVGRTMLAGLAARKFPVKTLLPVASSRSLGTNIEFKGQEIPVISVEEAVALRPDIALFSAGGDVSRQWAPAFKEAGTTVIDNSSAWRMDPNVPLVVPEVNADAIGDARVIANPNCSTIQLVMALKPLHDRFLIRRAIVSTYQSVTGTGQAGIDQLNGERDGDDATRVYPHPIDGNCLPHCDVFLENDFTKEEMKLHHETKKILGDGEVQVSATAVRVPVVGGHSESVYLELERSFSVPDVKEALQLMPGLIIQDDPMADIYPMPVKAEGKDEVFVGRIRRDLSEQQGLHLWIVSDNLRKGAATNAIQIAEYLQKSGRFRK